MLSIIIPSPLRGRGVGWGVINVGTRCIVSTERGQSLNTLKDILGKIDLEEGYERLTKREKKIITLYYLEGYKDEEIAFYYGVTRQNIFKIRKNGLTKLKKIKIFLI